MGGLPKNYTEESWALELTQVQIRVRQRTRPRVPPDAPRCEAADGGGGCGADACRGGGADCGRTGRCGEGATRDGGGGVAWRASGRSRGTV